MAIQFSKETRAQLLVSIKRFAIEELDADLGDLKASLLLDYVLKEVAPSVYNQAIADAQSFLQDKAEDLPGARHETEFGYWKR